MRPEQSQNQPKKTPIDFADAVTVLFIIFLIVLAACASNKDERGSFTHPAPIGISLTRLDSRKNQNEMAATVLEVLRGKEADKLAQDQLDPSDYIQPEDNTEYLAVKVKVDVLRGADKELVPLYPHWHFILRTDEMGQHTYSMADWRRKAGEGYPPFSIETWLCFLVEKESKPLLYFQPYWIFAEKEYQTSGAFFSLDQP